MKIISAAAMIMFGIIQTATATVTPYYITGTFADGETLNGSLAIDDKGPYNVMNVDIRASGGSQFFRFHGLFPMTPYTGSGPAALVFDIEDGRSVLDLLFANVVYDPNTDFIQSFASDMIIEGRLSPVGYGPIIYLTSGMISTSVPEPISIALLATSIGLATAFRRYNVEHGARTGILRAV